MKGIILIDVPACCDECGLKDNEYNYCHGVKYCGEHTLTGEQFIKRMEWCPIHTPLKLVDQDYYIYNRSYLFKNISREFSLIAKVKKYEDT